MAKTYSLEKLNEKAATSYFKLILSGNPEREREPDNNSDTLENLWHDIF